MFCEIGPAWGCVADYPGHIAPKSQQEHRLGSPILSEQIVNQPFKFVQYSQIDFPVPADLKIRPNELSTTPDLAVLLVGSPERNFLSRRIMRVGKLSERRKS